MKILFVISLLLTATLASAQSLSTELAKGQSDIAVTRLTRVLQTDPSNGNIRFQRDIAQVVNSVQTLVTRVAEHGIRNPAVFFGNLSNPVTNAPAISYVDIRSWLSELRSSLNQASASLQLIPDTSDLDVPLDWNSICLRVNATNKLVKLTDLGNLSTANLMGMPMPPGHATGSQIIHLSTADARWLEGYCHLVAGTIDCLLAYNFENTYNHASHLVFNNSVTPYSEYFKVQEAPGRFRFNDIIDVIALVHTLDFKLQDASEMQQALREFKLTLAQSRRMVQLLQKAGGSVPSGQVGWLAKPGQNSITGKPITKEMLTQWLALLDQTEAVLDGKLLAPYWRNAPGKGINIHKLFTEPKDFDLVLWLQGTGPIPYLEAGTVIQPQEWREGTSAFNGQFLTYAFWFN